MRILHRLLLVASAWTLVIPVVACIILTVVWGRSLTWIVLPFVVAVLVAAVITAVHHAEVIVRSSSLCKPCAIANIFCPSR
jgi:hypothetical protein